MRKLFSVITNLAWGSVIAMALFPREQWGARWVDMVFVGYFIFTVIQRLDYITEKLDS